MTILTWQQIPTDTVEVLMRGQFSSPVGFVSLDQTLTNWGDATFAEAFTPQMQLVGACLEDYGYSYTLQGTSWQPGSCMTNPAPAVYGFSFTGDIGMIVTGAYNPAAPITHIAYTDPPAVSTPEPGTGTMLLLGVLAVVAVYAWRTK